MISNLEKVAAAFTGNDRVKLISFSVMPEVDSVKRLQEYGKQHHIDPSQWWLLTGNTAQINQLGRLSYFSEKRAGLTKENSAFLHTESLLLIDVHSRIRGIYTATNPSQMIRLIEDINLLLEE
jgi:protein SCO1/2